ncbi:MAG TPA: helicase-related protein [Bacillota bacterium]|nr:helicase-related protein [Bacillota bacterium]HOL10348.1 helicase-related protein [Bacillota bacterium]HPO97364.1 helicase-related protein [Bacillota bacterium]
MLSPKYFVYSVAGKGLIPLVNVTNNPYRDALKLKQAGYQELIVLEPPQPIWVTEKVVQYFKNNSNKITKFAKIAADIICENLFQPKVKAQQIKLNELLESDQTYLSEIDQELIEELAKLFWGRSLLSTEIPELLSNSGYNVPWDPENWLQVLSLEGKIIRTAAINTDRFGIPFCRRCGSTDGIIETDCYFCGNKRCLTCTNCQTMGLAKSCIPLYYQPFPQIKSSFANQIQPRLDFDLTPPQKRAAQELENFYDSDQTNFLVWTVCGGGKTEVSFKIVARVLSEGGRVLFAIPRRDIVIELLPRFEAAFPDVTVTALYGGSGTKFDDVQLTLATTHQCLRFYQRFDLIILDEADAYPYQGSEMLHYALHRSLRNGGKLVTMTATPDQRMIAQVKSGKLPYISIPARYHRRPLALPEFIKLNLKVPTLQKDWEIPLVVQQIINETTLQGRRLLIFLPTINLIETFGRTLVSWGQKIGINGAIAHSKSENRTEIKEQILEGKLNFIVCSTIFERGITIPKLNVLVLFADDSSVFDCRTLVQIAGRVGRKGDNGRVVFAGKTISNAMKESYQWIATMNQEAIQLGYLDNN